MLLLPRQSFSPAGSIFCSRFFDVLDHARLRQDTGIQSKRPGPLEETYAMEGLLTVDQIFKYTPDVNQTISSCHVRDATNQIIEFTGSACYEHFRVHKYFTQEFVCYIFAPVVKRTIQLLAVTQARVSQYTVYDVRLTNERFNETEQAFVMLNREAEPRVARHFSSVLRVRDTNTGRAFSNWASMRSKQQVSLQLERPYDTACDPVPYDYPLICESDCLLSRYERIARVPSHVLIDRPRLHRPLAMHELDNRTIADFVSATRKQCETECHAKPCNSFYAFTQVFLTLDPEASFRLTKMTPGEPDLETLSLANMSFVTFFSYIAGCFNVWFGVSFLSLDLSRWREVHNRLTRSKRRRGGLRRQRGNMPLLSWTYFRSSRAPQSQSRS